MIYCEVMDRSKKEFAETTYAYDAFGRRILVQDKGEAALRTLYDGLTFDVIKQSPVFENGMFTDSNNTGIQWGAGKPTGDRYRYISDEDSKDKNRYFYLDENTYKTVNSRYRGERAQYTVNGSLAAQTSKDYGAEYFSTDLLGSVSSVTDSYGIQKVNYTYDAFGSLVQGELSDTTDFGYLAKQSDITAKLYDYGYRDYKPQVARFTTIDPIRDGENWFIYVNNDPIGFVDLLGLETIDGNTGMLNKMVDACSYLLSTKATLFDELGNNSHGIVNTVNSNGFIERVQTIKDYDMINRGKQLNNKTKGLLVISIGVGIVDAVIVGNKKPEDSDATAKRMVRNLTTIGATYLGSKIIGGVLGKAGAAAGMALGSLVEPGGGSALGGTLGYTIGYTAGSIGGAIGANMFCNYFFENKLHW